MRCKKKFAKHDIVMVPEISEKKTHPQNRRVSQTLKISDLRIFSQSCWKFNKQAIEKEPDNNFKLLLPNNAQTLFVFCKK